MVWYSHVIDILYKCDVIYICLTRVTRDTYIYIYMSCVTHMYSHVIDILHIRDVIHMYDICIKCDTHIYIYIYICHV